jgi:hypothetical protein
MPTLHELQKRFAAAVIGGDASEVARPIIDDAPGAAARVGIYVNHFHVTLIDALAATFPVVRELVGGPFFQAVARRYVREEPPTRPCLFEYGGGFPAFLERLPEARSLAYLADVARLEWAINEAWHAPDTPAVDEGAAARLIAAGSSDLGLRLHPSCRLVASPFPLHRIWQVHQKACREREAVDLDAGGVRLLVHRQHDEVGWIDLPPADFAFLDSMIMNGSLQKALTFARAVDRAFDPTAALAALIEGGLVGRLPLLPDLERLSPWLRLCPMTFAPEASLLPSTRPAGS